MTTATTWGGAGMLCGAATTYLLSLPFRPDPDDGWAGLGYALATLAVGAAVALVAGAVCVLVGLRRHGAPHAGRTALAFLPVAVVLGGFSAGVGALAAPAVARWLVDGFSRRSGWGPQQPSGRAQRIAVAVVVTGLAAAAGLGLLGDELGGRVHGAALTWIAVLPAVVVPPVLLLRRVLPGRVLVAAVAAAAALLALAVPNAVSGVKPTPARLEQIVAALPVPEGQSVSDVRTQVVSGEFATVPTTMLSTGDPVPPLGHVLGAPTDAGRRAADAWNAVLREQGWDVTTPAFDEYDTPEPLRPLVAGGTTYRDHVWLRATAVPYGDGALLVVTGRA